MVRLAALKARKVETRIGPPDNCQPPLTLMIMDFNSNVPVNVGTHGTASHAGLADLRSWRGGAGVADAGGESTPGAGMRPRRMMEIE